MIRCSTPAPKLRAPHPGLLLVLAVLCTPAAPVPADAPARFATVLRCVDGSAETVTAVWRQAVTRGLAEAAAGQEVILCHAGRSRPECAPEVLDGAPELHWSISTAVTIKHSLALIRVPLTLEVMAGPDVAPPEAGLFVIEDNFVLPEGGSKEGGRDPVLADRVQEVLANHAAVTQWFTGLRETPGLAIPIPGVGDETVSASASHKPTSPTTPTAAEVADWRRREEEILALLIDDRFADARQAADRLLEEDGLPPGQRDRVLRLRATAVKRGAAAQTQAAAPEPPTPEPEETFDYTFKVRVAPPGRGFLRGTDGRLRLFDGGLRFVPDATQRGGADGSDGWFLRWSEIRDWGEAEGLWDVSHPLELTSTDGDSIYFAVLDHDGRFRSGARLLSLLTRGAERARKR